MSSGKTDRVFKRIYYDPRKAGSYGGVESLHKAVEEQTGKKPAIAQVEDWLAGQDAYTLHKASRKKVC